MRKPIAGAAMAAGLFLVPATGALAAPQAEVFQVQDNNWFCHEDSNAELQMPENHCMNVRSKGTTLNLKVFEPDTRGPAESASFDPDADLRPCPHDPDADPDGTWWEFAPGLYVCHHSGVQQ